jgi:hypothetical protein
MPDQRPLNNPWGGRHTHVPVKKPVRTTFEVTEPPIIESEGTNKKNTVPPPKKKRVSPPNQRKRGH